MQLPNRRQQSMTPNINSDFWHAVRAVRRKGRAVLGTERWLQFYGLLKQGTMGDVNEEAVSRSDAQTHERWRAWNACKGMSMSEAKSDYVALLDRYDPHWRPEDATSVESDSDSDSDASIF